LSPVDFSAQARDALRAAAKIASVSKGRLVILYVNDPLLEAAASSPLGARGLAASPARDLRRFVDAALPAAMRSRLRPKCVSTAGAPAAEIGRVAQRERADLVVLATHGLGGASRLFFGSTTEAVLRKTSVPVLALPSSPGGRPSPTGRAWPPRRLIAPTALGPTTRDDISVTAAAARRLGARVQLLHVVPVAATLPRGRGTPLDLLEAATARLQTLADAAGAGDVVSECRVIGGDPPETIAVIAAREHAALVALTLRGGTSRAFGKVGSLAYHVLREAAVPVLALPPARLGRARRAAQSA
jgi:nucleotide-binding universal stress UspA family protein